MYTHSSLQIRDAVSMCIRSQHAAASAVRGSLTISFDTAHLGQAKYSLHFFQFMGYFISSNSGLKSHHIFPVC